MEEADSNIDDEGELQRVYLYNPNEFHSHL